MSEIRPVVSVIIPAYNEQARIAPTLMAYDRKLARSGAPYEIVVVDDGSADGTVALVEGMARERPSIRVIATKPNRGKGHAVRVGMLAARGHVRVMADADGSIPANELGGVVNPVLTGRADIAIGSRYVAGARVSAKQPLWRRLWSRLVNKVIRASLVPGVRDTQCGFKAFSAGAAEDIFARCQIDGWAFDLEALALAARRGYTVREVGVAWNDDERSRVNPLADFVKVVREWRIIRRNLKRGAYGQLAGQAVR